LCDGAQVTIFNRQHCAQRKTPVIMVGPPYVIGQAITFLPCGFFPSFFFPGLISMAAD